MQVGSETFGIIVRFWYSDTELPQCLVAYGHHPCDQRFTSQGQLTTYQALTDKECHGDAARGQFIPQSGHFRLHAPVAVLLDKRVCHDLHYPYYCFSTGKR
jgi:hypothetical protein